MGNPAETYDHYAIDPELLPMLPLFMGDLDSMAMPKEELDQLLNDLYAKHRIGPRDGLEHEERSVPGIDDDPEVPVRVFTPHGDEQGRGCFVHIHGGGWSGGSITETFSFCADLCRGAGIVVIDVEYRLAPDNPHPAALRDARAVLEWAAANADELGVDASRIGVGGGSAGGNLAAGLCLWVRDHGGPAIAFQLLDIPSFDDQLTSPSMHQFTDTPVLTRESTDACWRDHLGDFYGTDDVPYYAAPARCDDLAGLPSAYISVMEFDPLRDEAILYATRLLQAGVSVELHVFPGTFHASFAIPSAVSDRHMADMVAALGKHLGRDGRAVSSA